MAEVQGIDKLFSFVPRKRFGVFRKYGTAQFGFSNFGEDDIYYIRTPYGSATYGVDIFGDVVLLSGIYRTDNVTGRTKYYREPYYIPKNPRTVSQQSNRQKYKNAVAAWQALTNSQKEVYNMRARNKKFSGYNLFIKEYLLSN